MKRLDNQAEAAAEARKVKERAYIMKEKNYVKMRAHKHQARLSGVAQYTPRNGSLEINVSAITARGGGAKKRKSKKGSGDSDGNEEGYLKTARGYAHVAAVACGEHHMAIVHQSGELYTWGFGAAGRLGLDGYARAVRSWLVSPSVQPPVRQID